MKQLGFFDERKQLEKLSLLGDSPLYRHLTLSKLAYPKDDFFLREESFYIVASYLDEGYALEFQAHIHMSRCRLV